MIDVTTEAAAAPDELRVEKWLDVIGLAELAPDDFAEEKRFGFEGDEECGETLQECELFISGGDFHDDDLRFDPGEDYLVLRIRDALDDGVLTEKAAAFLADCEGGFLEVDPYYRDCLRLLVKTDADLLGVETFPECQDSGRPQLQVLGSGRVPITGRAAHMHCRKSVESPRLADDLDRVAYQVYEEREAARALQERRYQAQQRAAGDFDACRVDIENTPSDIPWLFPGVLRSDVPLLIGGAEKRNKTYFAMWLAVARSHGAPFLGADLAVEPAPVVFVAGEGSSGELQRRADRIRRFLGVEDSGLLHLVENPAFDLDNDTAVDSCKRFARKHRAKMVIFDPATRMLCGAGKGTDVQAMYERLRELDAIASAIGPECLPVPTWHFKEVTPFTRRARPDRSMLAGTGTAQWCRQWLLINDRTDWDGDSGGQWINCGSAEHQVELGTTFTTAGGEWSCEWWPAPPKGKGGEAESKAVAAKETGSLGLSDRQWKVFNALTDKPQSPTAIGKAAGVRHGTTSHELKELVARDLATAVKVGADRAKYRLADLL